MRKNKKAISGVVTTLFIIVFAILAVALLWTVVIKPLFNRGSSQIGLQQDCIDSRLRIDSINLNDNKVKISRGSGNINIEDIQIAVDDGEDRRAVKTGEGVEPNAAKTFNVTIDNGINEGDKVMVAPIVVGDDGEEFICDFVDTKTA